MPKVLQPKTSKLKARVAEKKPNLSRTAFKLLPKTSALLDWLLESTELSVSALVRTELEEVADSYPFWSFEIDVDPDITEEDKEFENNYNRRFFDALERIKSELPSLGQRRPVALDADMIELLAKQAKSHTVSRDAWFNLLIRYWALNWNLSLRAEIDEAPRMEKCAEEAVSLLAMPDFKELVKLHKIQDEWFIENLERAWYAAEVIFSDEALEPVLALNKDLAKKQGFVNRYEEIVGKAK